ncbi:MAG TPA: fibronectin type III domain-containing protein [Vicinamibacteria bacterium]|nr:fibronectin type III domain-containing protein [Vicinamibacteria bacterium]
MRAFRFAFILASGSVILLHAVATNGLAQQSPNRRVQARPFLEAARSSPDPEYVVVRFREGAGQSDLRSLPGAVRRVKGQSRSRLHRYSVPQGVSRDELLAALRNDPVVEEAGPVLIVRALEVPDDEDFVYQWHLHSTDGGAWADSAWDLAPSRGQGVVVAVIDTGVAYEDFTGTVDGFFQSFKRATDLDSTPFVSPWDFRNNDAHANDDNGHGTHVTGTIAQDTNNAFGVAGIAHASTIMPIKVLDYVGSGFADDLVEAIYYAVDNGARVINMSLGFPETGSPDAQGDVCTEIVGLNAVLDYAYDRGVVVVAAAGNDGGGTVLCPAAHPKVIAVAASRFDGQASYYSNSGTALDITAPGGDPSVDQNTDGYADEVLQETYCYDWLTLLFLGRYDEFCDVFYSGTSTASPHVAGTAALLLGEDPSLSPDEVRSHLISSARDRGAPGWDSTYGWGILDAGAAVASVLGVPPPSPPTPEAPTDLTATPVSSHQVDLSWTDNSTDETGFRLERSTDGGVVFTSIAFLEAEVTAYSNVNLAAGSTYHYRVRAHEGPYASPYSNVVSVTTTPLPGAPTNLIATSVSSSRIDLSWTDNSTSESGFKIERSTDGVNYLQIANRGANVTSFSNVNLTAGVLFYYRVRAYEGVDHSEYSNVVSSETLPPPAAPTMLAATAVSPSRIDLSWTDNSSYEAGFKIERSTDGVNFVQVTTRGANVTTFSNTNLTAGVTYHYRVRAYDGPNHSGYSNLASASTQGAPAAPSGLGATAVSSSRVVLSWTDNATNEAGYKVERGTDGVSFSQVVLLGANATTYSNTNLVAETTYYFRVRAYEGANHSEYSNVVSRETLPSPATPTMLTATAVSPSRIDLSWTDNSSYEAGFKIERSTDGINFVQVATRGANVTTYSNTSLSAGVTYHYRIRAYDGLNHSGYSNVASASTQGAPAAPSGLGAIAVSSSRIDLSWTDNATNEAGYKVERGTDGVSFSQVAVLGANATTYSNTNLVAETTYYYRVRAYEGANHSEYSDVVSGETLPPPAAPTMLTATAVSPSRIDLSWTDNSSYEAGFKIERSTDGVNFVQVATRGANVTTYSNTSLSAGVTYHYRVRAYDGPNDSGYSNLASASTQGGPAAPSGLGATAVSSSRIVLSWTDNATNEAGYKVERGTDGVSFSQVAVLGANATTYSNTNLVAETTYYYRVRAYEGTNHSEYSNIVSSETLPPPATPTMLSATAVSPSRIDLSWTDNSSYEAGFKIERSTDGVNFVQVATRSANLTTYSNFYLSAGVTYYYRIRAYDGPNHSRYSDEASATTPP